MTSPPNAFRSGESLVRLEPGDSTTGTWGITSTEAEAHHAANAGSARVRR
jgi:hypothetical protein